MEQRHFGFEISEALYMRALQTIHAIKTQSNSTKLNSLIVKDLIDITEVGFAALYYTPSDMVELSSVIKKAADTGMVAVKRGVHMVIRRLFKNMPITELDKLADYMGTLLTFEASQDSTSNYYIAYDLSPELHSLAQTLLTQIRQDPNVDGYRQKIISALNKLIRAGVEAYYEKPSNMISLGRVSRKTADIGISTAEKGSKIVVKKLFGAMAHDSLLPLSSYLETLLHQDLISSNAKTNVLI